MQRVPFYTQKEESRLLEIVAEVTEAMPREFQTISIEDYLPVVADRSPSEIYRQALKDAGAEERWIDGDAREQIAVDAIDEWAQDGQYESWLALSYRDERLLSVPISVLIVAELLLTAEAGGWSYEREAPNHDFDAAIAAYAKTERRNTEKSNILFTALTKESDTTFCPASTNYRYTPLYRLTRDATGEQAHIGIQTSISTPNEEFKKVILVRGKNILELDAFGTFNPEDKSSYRVNFRNVLYSK